MFKLYCWKSFDIAIFKKNLLKQKKLALFVKNNLYFKSNTKTDLKVQQQNINDEHMFKLLFILRISIDNILDV